MTTAAPKEDRKKVYEIVVRLLGRELHGDEHQEIKAAILEYVESEKKSNTELNKSLQICGRKRRAVATMLYHKGQKSEILEKDLLFLKEEMNLHE